MTWRPHSHARVDANNPRAFAICDRCGSTYNRVNLRAQQEWAGTRIVSKNILVCASCWDPPTPFLRVFTLPPDPVPVVDPRPLDRSNANDSFIATEGGDVIADETDAPFVTETTTAIDLLDP